MTSSNLIPTPITDKNGKVTTVYRSVEAPTQGRTNNMPAPVMEAFVPPRKEREKATESYEDRRARIHLENMADDDLAKKGELGMKAFESIGNLMMSGVSCDNKSAHEDFALRIGILGESRDFAPIILADRFAAVHYTLADAVNNDDEWDEPLELEFNGDDTSDWEAEYMGVNDHVQIIDLVMTLRENDLMGKDEIPEHGEARFLAHLYLSATNKLNYRHDDDETIEVIKIVDEFPEQTNLIAEGLDQKLHPQGIRALLEGDLHKGILSGSL